MHCNRGLVRVFLQTEVTTNWSFGWLTEYNGARSCVPGLPYAGSRWCSSEVLGSAWVSCHLCAHLVCWECFLHCQLKIRRRSSHHLHTQTSAMCCSFSIFEVLKTLLFLLLICKLHERQTWGKMQHGHGFCSQLLQIPRTDVFGSAGALTPLPQRQRGRRLRHWGFLYTKLHKWGRVVFWTALVK